MRSPVGMIEFISTKGSVEDSVTYYSEKDLINAFRQENYYGARMNIVFYKDANGGTIDMTFLLKADPPNITYEITDPPMDFSQGEFVGGFSM